MISFQDREFVVSDQLLGQNSGRNFVNHIVKLFVDIQGQINQFHIL